MTSSPTEKIRSFKVGDVLAWQPDVNRPAGSPWAHCTLTLRKVPAGYPRPSLDGGVVNWGEHERVGNVYGRCQKRNSFTIVAIVTSEEARYIEINESPESLVDWAWCDYVALFEEGLFFVSFIYASKNAYLVCPSSLDEKLSLTENGVR